jgi:phytoene synthase
MRETSAAYRHCEEVTRAEARNFYYGIRLLPPQKRTAMCAVYSFARRVDDVADGDMAPGVKLDLLDSLEEDVGRLGHARDDPVLAALADAHARFPIPVGAWSDLIEGARMDVRGETYATFEDLVVYCRRVAGSIGRLSLGVFGAARMDEASPLADDLGVALQITNILRDVHEDRAAGRVYLPREDLLAFGCDPLIATDEELAPLVAFEARRARDWFERGLTLLPLLDRRSAACVSAMAGIYRRVLARIEARPASALAARVSLPAWEKGLVAARSLMGAAP